MVRGPTTCLTWASINLNLDEQNMHFKTFVDIKSELLRDILRQLLQGVNTVSLRVDKPEVRIPPTDTSL